VRLGTAPAGASHRRSRNLRPRSTAPPKTESRRPAICPHRPKLLPQPEHTLNERSAKGAKAQC